jgi:ATP-dependent exoDNAse (exonuclease V) alpha subunit
VICDEAGLKSNRQGAELFRLAQKHDMRVLLVGDVRQHVSVEAGDFLRVLEAHSKLGRCQVEEIHRQISDDYRAAVTQMATGNVRQGLEGLDRLNWIREGQSDYLEQAAADFLRLTDQGRDLDRCLAVSFTWEENHRFTDSIRKGLKECGALPPKGTRLTVHESLRWTNQQKGNWQRYEPGQVVTFAPERNRPASSATVARVERKKVVVALASKKEIALDLRRPDSFDVSRPRQIEVTPGDKILIRANDKRLGLTNGQVLTISSIAPDGALQTKEGLCVPTNFGQWCHGYVVTSHKAQGWTADHVVVAAERFTSKGAYVACSRGRRSCIVHTPDKARLIERLPEGNRCAALDALSKIRP